MLDEVATALPQGDKAVAGGIEAAKAVAVRDRAQPAPDSPFTESREAGQEPESLWETLDRTSNAALSRMTLGTSPVALMMDTFDWAAHLAMAPGKRLHLAERAISKSWRFWSYAWRAAFDPETPPCITPLPQDNRFEHPGWQRWPYNLIHQSFLLQQQWWHNATTGVRGVSKRGEAAVEFGARQALDTVAPSNFPFLNPEVIETTAKEGGDNLRRGAQYWYEDTVRNLTGAPPEGSEAFRPGEHVAVTPGKVIFRNRLMELIQYSPTTAKVRKEPVLMLSAWMMKYYIMDLSPHNSMVKYLVDQGHTVFMISWMNPGPEDRDLGMEDYRKQGILAALDVVNTVVPDTKVHAVGYCLGGILLTITAAAMARDGDRRLASITLFTTMTDFTEVGEMAVFMNPSQVSFLEDVMWQQGYLDGKQAAGSFQLLKSRDLIWSKMVREYMLGDRQPLFDLMAWNADGTRMPFRQHSELLRHLYRDNELFQGHYRVDGRPISISDIHIPIFSVAASRDHVAPWRSVYKLHLQSDASELTFVLTTGGHNVGIVNEPGHPRRKFRIATLTEGQRWPNADDWLAQTPQQQGSWWPAWQDWLGSHSDGMVKPPAMGAPDKGIAALCDAPGTYVHMR
ncbi:MAG: polyhydroxyalkanoic acid synthase [Rhodospirillaceae bacterium]|nr:polyhydroxyalkanoic acid synthase [Rhodospirillaceae bacterium]